jgi:hypothetical protein
VDKDTKIGEEKVSLNYASGPYLYEGSNEFAVMYQENDKHIYKKIIYSLPNSTTNVLINDIYNKVELSTFLADGRILVKIAQRFLLFDPEGTFTDEIEFEDLREEREAEAEADEQKRKIKIQADKLDKQLKKSQTEKPGFNLNWGKINSKANDKAVSQEERA